MDVSVTPYAPAPGSVVPGNLYADLQSRTLWLGVNSAVDPSGAVLMADILGLQDQMQDLETTAKAYTDTQVALRAPLSHTHLSSQITDFDEAVAEVAGAVPGLKFNRGAIMMYHGSIANIGVGDWAGWSLCDGSNGTPDLRDRFIIGAGNKTPGAGTPVPIVTSLAGAHTPVIQGTTLTLAQIPSHSHSVSGSFSGSGANYTDTHGGHQHGCSDSVANIGGTGSGRYQAGGYNVIYSAVGGAHNHYVSISVSGSISGTAAAAGSGTAHLHGANAVPDHSHGISTTILREAIPYYALAFVMKL